MEQNKISTVIVTRNRQEELKHCLGSLAAQTTKLDELIIVDNNSQDNTKQIVSAFSRNVIFTVRYVKETKIGYPIVYNRGLKEAQYNWVAFIDDDCVASKDWFTNIKNSIKSNRQTEAILGKSDTYYKQNIYSLASVFFDSLWKANRISENSKHIIDLEILDTKNIIYNKSFFLRNKTLFDENRPHLYKGRCQDSDRGMQIQQAGGRAIYNPKIFVLHKDPISFSNYIKLITLEAKACIHFSQKWSKFRKTINRTRCIKARQQILKFKKEYNLTITKTFQLIIILSFTIIEEKITRLLYRTKTFFLSIDK